MLEASFELDPPLAKRIEYAAWQISRAARTQATIYRSDFDGSEQGPRPPQPPEEMAKEAEKIATRWGAKVIRPPTKPGNRGENPAMDESRQTP